MPTNALEDKLESLVAHGSTNGTKKQISGDCSASGLGLVDQFPSWSTNSLLSGRPGLLLVDQAEPKSGHKAAAGGFLRGCGWGSLGCGWGSLDTDFGVPEDDEEGVKMGEELG